MKIILTFRTKIKTTFFLKQVVDEIKETNNFNL